MLGEILLKIQIGTMEDIGCGIVGDPDWNSVEYLMACC